MIAVKCTLCGGFHVVEEADEVNAEGAPRDAQHRLVVYSKCRARIIRDFDDPRNAVRREELRRLMGEFMGHEQAGQVALDILLEKEGPR